MNGIDGKPQFVWKVGLVDVANAHRLSSVQKLIDTHQSHKNEWDIHAP